MEATIPNRLSTLLHLRRLAPLRKLMRRYPDRVPATELARALGLKPNTLSAYENALMQAGLVSRERDGQPISAHWGLPDPVRVKGSDAEKSLAFHQTYGALRNRMSAFTALPLSSLDRMSLQKAVDEIGQSTEERELK